MSPFDRNFAARSGAGSVGHDAHRQLSLGDAAALIALALLAAYPVVPARNIVLPAVGLGLALAGICRLPGDRRFSRFARALVGALCISVTVAADWYVWPFYLLFPLMAACLLAALSGSAEAVAAAAVRGRFGWAEGLATLAIATLAAAALTGWLIVFQPDVTALRDQIPDWPWPGLLAAGLAFSIINALLEELIWRGVLLRWLLTFSSPAIAVAIQAASFGAAHFAGFPSGIVGVGLASAYGLMLGAVALRSRGLLAPVAGHILADAVIFALLLSARS